VRKHVLPTVHTAGVIDIAVVVAPHGAAQAAIATAAGAHVVQLAEDTPDMRATCQHGLAWIEAHFHPADDDGWLLLPADHPTVRPEIVCALLNAAQENSRYSIVVPTYRTRRGHPTWLRWAHADAIRALPADQGLNAFIRARAGATRELPWASDEILRDLDTPEDYGRLLSFSVRTAPCER
jgi:molybdenum cofactor cytidylyltransferase